MIGSIRVALRAGSQHAKRATAARKAETTPTVTGSPAVHHRQDRVEQADQAPAEGQSDRGSRRGEPYALAEHEP